MSKNFNDLRAKQIMNEYKRLGPDDTFRFHCTQCGKCCVNREDILLNPRDLFRIAKHLGLTVREVYERYCETYIGENSRVPIIRLKPIGSIKRCPLLKDRKCLVHEAKPTVCALFPLGRIVELPKDAGEPKFSDAEVRYIYSDPHCGDASEEHTVRQWFEAFNLPLEDDFFLQWHQTVLTVGTAVKKLLKEAPPAPIMTLLWSAIFETLYMRYQTEDDFDTQFSQNSTEICELVRDLVSCGGESLE